MKNFARKAFLLSVALTSFVLFGPETRAEIISDRTVLNNTKKLGEEDTLQFDQGGDIYAPNVSTTTDIATVIAIKAGGDLRITFTDTADPHEMDGDGASISARIYAKNTNLGNIAIAIDLESSNFLDLTNSGPADQTIFPKSVSPNEGETIDNGAIAIRTNSNSNLNFAGKGVTLKADVRNFYQDPPGAAAGSCDANLIGDCFGLRAASGLTIISNITATLIDDNLLESLASAEFDAGANILVIAASASICDSKVESVTVTYGEKMNYSPLLRRKLVLELAEQTLLELALVTSIPVKICRK